MIQGPCIPIGLLDAVPQHSREWKLRRSSFTFVSHACIFGVCVREKSPLASLPASHIYTYIHSVTTLCKQYIAILCRIWHEKY